MTIYFIQLEQLCSIKIGYTAGSPQKRMAQLQTGQPGKLTLLGTIPGDKSVEANLHKELKEYRLNGEWFSRKVSFIVDHLIKKQGPWYLCREPLMLWKRVETQWPDSFETRYYERDYEQYNEVDTKKALRSLSGFKKASEKFKNKHGFYPKDPNHPIFKILDQINPDAFNAANYIAAYSLG